MHVPVEVVHLQERLNQLPEDSASVVERVQLLAQLARTFHMGRRHPREAREMALQAQALLDSLPVRSTELQLSCLMSLTSSHFHCGEYTMAVKYGEAALRLTSSHTPPQLMWYIYHKMGASYINLSFNDLALEYLHYALDHAERVEEGDPRVIVLVDLGVCYHWSGNPEKGIRMLERAMQVPEPITPFRKSLLYNQLAGAYLAVRRLVDAEKVLAAAFAHMELHQELEFRPALLSTRADLLLEQGRIEESEACLQEFRQMAALQEEDAPRLEYLTDSAMARWLMRKGDLPAAQQRYERCYTLAKSMNMLHQLQVCCEQLGYIAEQLGQHRASAHYEREARNVLKAIHQERTRITVELYEIRMEAQAAKSALTMSQQKNQQLQSTLVALEQAQKELLQKTLNLEEVNRKIHEISIRDPLTGVYNRRLLTDRLEEYFRTAERYQQSLSVMMLDIDHFKSINDRYGHGVGDQVLKMLAQVLMQTVRTTDLVARYGGEEFVVMMPCTDLQQGQAVAERVRHTIETHHWNVIVPGLEVTLSGGLAQNIDATSHENLLAAADRALYRAKALGRNQVSVY